MIVEGASEFETPISAEQKLFILSAGTLFHHADVMSCTSACSVIHIRKVSMVLALGWQMLQMR